MIEVSLKQHLIDNLVSNPETVVSWGKEAKSFTFTDTNVAVSFFKLPSLSSTITPTFLDEFQINVRAKYIDVCTPVANEIVKLFQLYFGTMGVYQITVDSVNMLGQSQEDIDIVNTPISLTLKY